VDRNIFGLTRVQVKNFDGAELFDDDCVGAGGGSLEIEAVTVQNLRHLLARRVIGKETDGTVAVRKEIDGIADPHGMVIVGVVARNFHHRGIVEIGYPDRSGLAAVITLPGLLPFGMWNVRQVSSIGRKAGVLRDRERQFGRHAALDGNGIELVLEVHEAVTPRAEQNLLAVGSPARDIFFGGMIGESPRHATSGGDHVDISIAIVFAGEGDHRTVRGKVREGLDADSRSEPMRIAAIAADDPEVIGVVEDDSRLAHGGKAQQKRRIRLGGNRYGRDEGEQQHREQFAHVGSDRG
jgi:hypothetical protein